LLQKLRRFVTIGEIAAGKFPNHKRGHDDIASTEERNEFWDSLAEVIDPD
jgi:hypothetical protein